MPISLWGTPYWILPIHCTMPFFFFFINLFIYFLAVLGLRFCARAFSSCVERGPLFIAVRGPLTVAASPVAEHRLQTRRLSSWGSRAQLLRGMWDLPRPGLEPVSPALAGRLSTTAPPRKPHLLLLFMAWNLLKVSHHKYNKVQIPYHGPGACQTVNIQLHLESRSSPRF